LGLDLIKLSGAWLSLIKERGREREGSLVGLWPNQDKKKSLVRASGEAQLGCPT